MDRKCNIKRSLNTCCNPFPSFKITFATKITLTDIAFTTNIALATNTAIMSTDSSDKCVSPDQAVLKYIFHQAIQTGQVSIFNNDWVSCVFKVDPEASSTSRYKEPVVVRLEATDLSPVSEFALTAEIQKLASDTLPGLVPSVLEVGQVSNADGREFSFSVVEFVDGVTLESVWAELSETNKNAVVSDILAALKKLHARGLRDETVQAILWRGADSQEDAAAPKPLLFGGAHTQALTTGGSLLYAIVERWMLGKPFCDIEKDENSGSITIKSHVGALGSITIDQHEVNQWPEQAVLCHNDLTPRNLLLRKKWSSSENYAEYRLAAIIDWELGGLYPAAYEAQLQDTYLSGGNRHASFYLMLKKQMKALVPRNKAQEGLLRAMELIWESQQQVLVTGRNVPAQIRERFLDYCRLTRDEDAFAGWVNKGGDLPAYDDNAILKMEDDVLANGRYARRGIKRRRRGRRGRGSRNRRSRNRRSSRANRVE